MGITITVSHTTSDPDFKKVEALAKHLQGNDYNFSGRAICVERGLVTEVKDTQDALRGALLWLMVEAVLNHRTPSRPGAA
jgi:hypothetical protein